MLISHDHKFVYISTSRVSGWEAEAYFERYCVAPGSYRPRVDRAAERTRHGAVASRYASAAKQPNPEETPGPIKRPDGIRNLLGAARWAEYLKFAVARNPFDACVAWFHVWMPDYERERLSQLEFGATRQVFRDWMRVAPHLPNFERLCVLDGAFILDEVIRYEALEEGVERICGRLGLDYDPANFDSPYRPPRLFAPVSDYYDADTRAIVREEFRWAFRTFGYDPES